MWFLGTLVPVIGLIQVGSQALADRYTYIPLIGVFIAVVWTCAELGKSVPKMPVLWMCLGAAILVGCAWTTRHQLAYWQTDAAVFQHALEVTTENARLWNGHSEAAAENFAEAVRLDPSLKESVAPFWPPAKPK